MNDPFTGIQDKDLANFCRDLVKRGYEVRHMGTDHFQPFWHGEHIPDARIPLTPRSGNAFTRCKAAIKRFEVAKGTWVAPKKSERPKKAKPKAPRMGKFVMPFAGDVSDRRPASIAPSQYTVATMLGADAMMKLAEAVMPERLKEVTMNNTQQRPKRSWTLEEKAAMVKRYRDAVLVQRGEAVLEEMDLYHSNITSFVKTLKDNGWDPDATEITLEPATDEQGSYTPAFVEAITGVVVADPVFDPDEEITELTQQWSELVARKRELAASQEGLSATIDRLLTQAEEAEQQRDQVNAEAADVAASITKTRKRLAEMARED